jgi:hypothetical protein
LPAPALIGIIFPSNVATNSTPHKNNITMGTANRMMEDFIFEWKEIILTGKRTIEKNLKKLFER